MFESPEAARAFQAACPLGRIYTITPRWVYLPLPESLLRARAARGGLMSWEFSQSQQAADFHREICSVGTVYQSTAQKPQWDHNVYIGTYWAS